ncbi:E3 ubiquitin-protein ligase ZSWIM2 [Mytilus galloprovincialis]|uniref:E3 ubiquitin-protein ligase ZSWIM2 n=1 Tax=Mytilus galloprovincialis TaxID=29158 RepID=A0A8B6CBI8_MYTGA|nr:E3 ubiquitin-protein ligase ZSWIM2 [Mytilus galloprovincialis]
MSRSVAWRKTCNELVFWRQCQALNATIYILRETGPTGFLLKEEGETKPVKAYLGDPHKCTCTQFQKDRDLCRHLCWLILKKFRVTQNNPISWQLGLVDRELNEVLHGHANKQPPKPPVRRWSTSGTSAATATDSRPTIRQKDITDDDCCPICQDELLNKHIPVTYCKFGCGNSIHIKCMKVYAEHQKTTGDSIIKCPFCREDFGPLELLKQEVRNAMGVQQGGRMDRHLGTSCQSCRASPIEGKCYRCSICTEYNLCQTCFNTQIHTQHPFDYRHKRNQRWRPAQRTYGAMLPQAVADQLVNRDITEEDFELLMQLENNNIGSDIPEEVINSFPLEKVRDSSNLLQPGMQCRICLRGYEVGQFIRKLPRCKHKFHKDCIDNWLLHSHATCPADGQVVWDPVTAQAEAEDRKTKSLRTKKEEEGASNHEDLSLILPGVGIIRQDRKNEPKADSSKGARRPMVKPQRLSDGSNSADVNSQIRANFTLDGRSVGPRTNENEPEATSSNHLPGNRLLNRTQSQRQILQNHVSSFGSQPGSYHSGQQNSDSQNGGIIAQSGTDNSPQTETISELPIGHKNLKHSSIFGHLSMLNEENRPDSNRSSQSTPQRSRNSIRSCNEMRSPFGRDLPTLIESDLENVPGIDSDANAHSKKGVYNDSQNKQFFQKLPRLQLPLDNDIPSRANSIELTSIRSTPDSRSQSQRSLQGLRITPRNSAMTDTTSDRRNISAQSEIVRRPSKTRRPDDNGRWSQAESEISTPGSMGGIQSEPLHHSEALSDRLQLLDLYLGNDPRDQPAVNRVVNLPPRPMRRALGGSNRRRQNVRRVRSNEFSLDGSALANITLRDMI